MKHEAHTSDATKNVPITIAKSADFYRSQENMFGDFASMMIEFPTDVLKDAAGVTIGVISPFEFFTIARVERLTSDGGDRWFVHGYMAGWEEFTMDDEWLNSKNGPDRGTPRQLIEAQEEFQV